MLPVFIIWSQLSCVVAQTLTGVVAEENGSPVVSANVFIPDLDLGTETNQDGRFVLTGLPASSLTIHISYVGYRPETRTVDLSEGDADQSWDITTGPPIDPFSADRIEVIRAGQPRVRDGCPGWNHTCTGTGNT